MNAVATLVRRVLGDAAADQVLATVDLTGADEPSDTGGQTPSVAGDLVERADGTSPIRSA